MHKTDSVELIISGVIHLLVLRKFPPSCALCLWAGSIILLCPGRWKYPQAREARWLVLVLWRVATADLFRTLPSVETHILVPPGFLWIFAHLPFIRRHHKKNFHNSAEDEKQKTMVSN
jgi:hypothetical protein